ncbi:T9SS type A sorting domain-containing protein, partial [bacterium]|nr:T9SS type A sorting domain-containing protein [bacterium]
NIDSKIVETHSIIDSNIATDIRKVETIYTNQLKTLVTEYTATLSGWSKTIETQFFYSSTKLTDSTLVAKYNNNELLVSYKTSYNYNTDASLKSVFVQVKNNSDLMYSNVSKSVYNYNANSISSLRNYGWNSKTTNWENDSKLEYLYNKSGTVSEEILWQWKFMFWEQVIRYAYEHDADNQIFKKLVSAPIYRDWRNTNSVNYLRESNSRNMTIESVYGFWGGKAGDKLNTHISFPFNDETIIRKAETIQLTYIPFVESSVNNPSTNPSLVKVYPNPSHGLFYISNFDAVNSSWTLTGLNGTIYRNSEVNLSSSIIDITDLPNGIYLLNIRSASENGTHKIVKY